MNELMKMVLFEKKDIFLALLAGTISGLTAVALFAQSGFLISKAALFPPFYIILILTAFLKLFGVAKSASKYAERYISHRVTFRLLSDIRMRFFERLEPLANKLFTTYRSGDLLGRITSDVDVLQNFFLRVVYPPLVALLVFISTIFFTMWFSYWVALVLLVGFIFASVIMPAMLISQKQQALETKHDLGIELTEYLYGYRDLKLHDQLAEKEEMLRVMSQQYAHQQKETLNCDQRAHTWNQLISLTSAFFVVALGAYFVSIDSLDGLYLAMLILISLTVFETAIPLALVPTHYKGAVTATKRLNEITEHMQVATEPLQQHVQYSITSDAVSFLYEDASRPALQPVSFTIMPGEKIAIVGPSGSGKSTLFQLLIKGLDATTGQISIHGQHIETIEEQSLWCAMSIQLQHNHFFSGTLRENLLIAKENATEKELEQALQLAVLLKSLDDRIYEKGGNLSGGEKQRLAFARVLLKNGAIWLLDEPFTSVDAKTERQLFDTLLTAGHDKTVIMITHKLGQLERMDRIFVMQNGHLVETGTSAELMNKRGLFFEMKT